MSRRADRHTARTRNRERIEQYPLVPDFKVQSNLGISDIDMQIRAGIQQHRAERRADFLGSARVVLVDAARKDFEALCLARRDFPKKAHRFGRNRVLAPLRETEHRANRDHAEDPLKRRNRILVIISAVHIDINAAVLLHNVKGIAERLQGKTELPHQGVLKLIAVFPLDADLAVFDQKRLIFHPLFLTV